MTHARGERLTVALIRDVFFGRDAGDRLLSHLEEAKAQSAELALLPELPVDRWAPATDQPREEDAEPVDGPRHQLQAGAAARTGIGLVGGAIVIDPQSGLRHNTALVFDADGKHVASYRKTHLPEEPGFWETSHYAPGREMASVIGAFSLPIGIQICSDINRPEGCHLLGAMGAEVILAPRATEPETFPFWRLVFQANALTSGSYVLSVGRPAPEDGVPLGGPSIAVGPDGQVLLETTDTVAVVTLERAAIQQARTDYPGYLPIRARLYADAWDALARRDG